MLIDHTNSMLAVSWWSFGTAGSIICDQTELFNRNASLVLELQDLGLQLLKSPEVPSKSSVNY